MSQQYLVSEECCNNRARPISFGTNELASRDCYNMMSCPNIAPSYAETVFWASRNGCWNNTLSDGPNKLFLHSRRAFGKMIVGTTISGQIAASYAEFAYLAQSNGGLEQTPFDGTNNANPHSWEVYGPCFTWPIKMGQL